MGTPGHDGGVDAVGCVEGEGITFLPVVDGLEALAEGDSGLSETSEGVVALAVGILEDDYSGQPFLTLSSN